MSNSLLLTLAGRSGSGQPFIPPGTLWQGQATPADNAWMAVEWIPELGLFVAVAESGASNRVMTSPDGENWTIQTSPALNVEWWSLAYGAGLVVAVARGFESGHKVMTSPDAITWTTRPSAQDSARWRDVVWVESLGLFVAVGHAAHCMTSPDGINWTLRALPVTIEHDFISVCFGNGLLVAVANYGADNLRVCTSPDGITWTARSVPAKNAWRGVCFGDGLFVAVANPSYDHEAPGQLVMTSPDGVTWTLRNTPGIDQWWEDVAWGNGYFAAVSSALGGNQRAMTSRDGITWTLETTPTNAWRHTTYHHGKFVAVGFSGSGNRAMTRTTFVETSDSVLVLHPQVFARDALAYGAETSPLMLEGFYV